MYQQRESLGGTGDDRVMGIFTLSNLGAAAICALTAWMTCRTLGIGLVALSAGWWLVAVLITAAAGLGIVFTIRWTGISLLDRVMLGVGFHLKRAAGGTVVTPPPVAPRPSTEPRGMLLMRDGVVVARPVVEEDAGG